MKEKTLQMLTSADPEIVNLGMELCRQENLMLWSCIIGYTGLGEVTKEALESIAANEKVTIGTVVRYKGMQGCPNMVVNEMTLKKEGNSTLGSIRTTSASFLTINPHTGALTPSSSTTSSKPNVPRSTYYTSITCKYYNKSTQKFETITDRIECFEIVDINKKEE